MTDQTQRMTGDEYMQLLEQRRDAWEAARVARERPEGFPQITPKFEMRPLLEWFVEAGDDDLVTLPESTPKPKREPKPRVYRSAASLREERDRAQRQLDALTGDDGDRAAANLSPTSRNRAARNAGRARFARLDRDLERYTQLKQQVGALNTKIYRAETRERAAERTTT